MANCSRSLVLPQLKSGNNWRAVLITPGKGSSGVYTEAMLKEYGPKAFKKGTHSYVDHPRSEEDIRSPKNLIGVLAEDARYEEGVGLVAELEVMPHWKEFVEAVAPHTGLSIYAMGEGNYNDDGEVVVENLIPHTQNSVDLVSYPGRPGSEAWPTSLYEAAVAMVAQEDLPDAYRPATSDDVPEGSACGNCSSLTSPASRKIKHTAPSGTTMYAVATTATHGKARRSFRSHER
jgi:hypothetical protein